MRGAVVGCLIGLSCLAATVAQAQVHVDIGINLPGPPQWTVVPGLPVYYAPTAPANVFFYNQQHYAFVNGAWYVGPRYNGPWIAVAPQFVPAPLLRVPVRYYHVPPPHWSAWRRESPPRWDHEWGRDWNEHREGWRGEHARREEHRH
jgi:hypothetical protein